MKSKLTKRFLAVACVAVVLSVLFALTGFAAEISTDGTVFKGLDPEKTYSIAPYAMLGPDTTRHTPATGITGVTECDLKNYFPNEEGLFAIYTDSKDEFALIYIQAKYATLKDFGNFTEGNAKPWAPSGNSDKSEWITGYFTKHHNSAYAASPTFGGYNFLCDWRYYVKPQTIHAAMKTADPSDDAAALEFAKSKFRQITFNYAYSADEVVPVKMLGNINFRSYQKTDASSPLRVKAQPMLEVFVMGVDGTITTHTILGEKYAHNTGNSQNNSVNIKINVQDIETLPEEGWIVAWRYYPIYEFNFEDITSTNLNSTGDHYCAFTWVGMDDYYEIILPENPAPEGITVEGTVFKGLDPNKSYAVSSYSIAGAVGTAKEISGVTEFDVSEAFSDPAGLYGIYIKGDDNYFADSKASVVYIESKWKDRKAIGTLNDAGTTPLGSVSQNTEWQTGNFLGFTPTSNTNTNYKNHSYFTGNNYVFNTDWVSYYNFTSSTDKAVIINDLKKRVLRYAYTPEEIIPVTDLKYIKVGATKYNGSKSTISIAKTTPKVEFYVMDAQGNVTPYTWTGEKIAANVGGFNDKNTITVDVQSTEGLPETGWIVGIKYHPFAEIEEEDITLGSNPKANCNTVIFFGYGDEYDIHVDKFDAPQGVEIDGTVISGLDPNKTYSLTPYTFNGADTENSVVIKNQDVVDGVYECDPEKFSGLWGFAVAEDDYTLASDATLIYFYGLSSDRKLLGQDKKFTCEGTQRDGFVTYAGNSNYGTEYNDYTVKRIAGLFSGYRNYWNGTHNYHYFIHDWGFRGKYTAEELKTAIEEGDEEKVLTIREATQKLLTSQMLTYTFDSSEIIPVDEAYNLGIGAFLSNGAITASVKMKLVLYVMAPDGSISTCEWIGSDKYTLSRSVVKNVSIDIQAIENLPEEGWIVGFDYIPAAIVELEDITSTSKSSDKGLEIAIQFYGEQYKIKEDAPTPTLSTFPVIPGGFGEIAGLNKDYVYEVKYLDAETGKWGKWMPVPAGSTAIKVEKAGEYKVRAAKTDSYLASRIVSITVMEYDSSFEPYNSQITKMYLPNDFVEATAEYELDVTTKNWVSRLALENIKTLSPNSQITISGDGYKFVVIAEKIDTAGSRTHYYDMSVSFDGESRFDKSHAKLKELAGDKYLKSIYFESTSALPFEEVTFMVYVGTEKNGADVELRSHNARINKLRKVETSVVADGWITFTNCSMPYVILVKD